MHQHATLEDTVYFWFAANNTSGSGADGASAAADVRLAGAVASAAPVLSPTPSLLSHANYPAGCYEVAVAATAGNGFSAGATYGVFCTLAVDSQNPTGFIGSFDTYGGVVRATTLANTLDINADGNVTAANVGAAGGSINTVSESFTLTTGTVASGTYADTISINATYHQLADDGGTLDAYYQFDITSFGTPNTVEITGHLTGNNDDVTVYAYNWGSTTWEVLGPIAGQSGSTDLSFSFPLFTQHVGSGANLGKVRIRFEDSSLTSANLYIDQIYVGYSSIPSTTGYEIGAVWLDTVNGTAGTTVDYNGVANRPVSTITDALTLAAAIGLKKIMIVGDSTVTLAAGMDDYTLEGTAHWTLNLGGQSCENTTIVGAYISGTSTGAMHVVHGHLQNSSIEPSEFHYTSIDGDIVLSAAGTYNFDSCRSGVAGTGTPSLDFGAAIGNTNVNMRRYSGGIEIKNIGQNGTDNMSLEGDGQYILNANCAGGTLAVRGNFTETDNASGVVTVSDNARIDIQQIRDAQKLAPSAGSPATGSVDKHLDDIEGYVDTIESSVARILGLSYENTYQHTRVYVGGKLTSAKMDTYNSKANAQTHDGTTGIVAKYTLTFTYSGAELATMEVVRDS